MFQDPYYWRPFEELMQEGIDPGKVSCPNVVDLIHQLGTDVIIAEVGVAFGLNLINLVERCPNVSKAYAVDCWLLYQDWGDDCPHGAMPENVMSGVKGKFYENLAAYAKHVQQNKIEVIEKPSQQAVAYVPQCDFIFIDANHATPHVLADCLNYWPKIKPGGILAGHDWDATQVRTGVHQFLATHGIPESKLSIMFHTNTPPVWWLRKEEE